MTLFHPIVLSLLPLLILAASVSLGRAIVGASLGPLAAAFPPREHRPDAVTRRYQSFSFGIVTFGRSVLATADSAHLHLSPHTLARVFGMKPMSVPWDALTLRPARPSSRFLVATARAGAGTWTIRGPRWCLELAAPPPARSDPPVAPESPA